jgi:hypothetical protein
MKLVLLFLCVAAAIAETFAKPRTEWSGILVDGGCQDRSLANLRSAPILAPAQAPPSKTDQAAGIKISPRIRRAEQADALQVRTPDHASRYPSASCALTGDTIYFALLLPDGLLLDLDGAGNTLAFEAFRNSPAGRAILNGKVSGIKPNATVHGIRDGARLLTRSVTIAQ